MCSSDLGGLLERVRAEAFRHDRAGGLGFGERVGQERERLLQAPDQGAVVLGDQLVHAFFDEAADGIARHPAQDRRAGVARQDGGAVVERLALAQHHGVTAPTASETVSALVRKELVARNPSTSDRRSHRLSLTKAGQELLSSDPLHKVASAIELLSSDQRAHLGTALDLLAGELHGRAALDSRRLRAARTKPVNSGCPSRGVDLNSGWNCVATNQGCEGSSTISTRPSGDA